MPATAIRRKVVRKVRLLRRDNSEQEQAAAAARYEQAITGGRSATEQANIYRRMAADLPREHTSRASC